MTQEGSFSARRLREHSHKLRCPNCHYENSVNPKTEWSCTHCGKLWTPSSYWKGRWFSRRGILVSFFSVAIPIWIVGIILILIIVNSKGDPISAVKTSVRSHYDQKYGSQSRQRLREDFGWFYRGESEARNDYAQHHPNR